MYKLKFPVKKTSSHHLSNPLDSSASQLNSLWATIALLPLCFGCTVLVTVVLVCVKRKYKGHHGVQTMNAQETEELVIWKLHVSFNKISFCIYMALNVVHDAKFGTFPDNDG